jgi:Zn-dependent protease with chaperone function
VDRRTHRLAYRLTRQQFAALVDAPLDRRSVTTPQVVTTVVALLLLDAVLSIAAAGVWLVLDDFPRFTIIPGPVLLAVAVYLRPRLGKLHPDLTRLDRQAAPALFDLVDRVSAAIGATTPDVIAVDGDFNAYTATVGVRRRRVLCLGLPLWSVLDAQERVALIGHEIAHFVSGDQRRGLLTQVAVRTVGEAAVLAAPGRHTRGGGIIELIGDALATMVQWVVSRFLFGIHLLILWVSQRDWQRAEYLADQLAARAAGSAAVARLCDVLVLHDSMDMVIRREARAHRGPAAWRAAGDQVRRDAGTSIGIRRQLTQRDEVSLFASHPPAGLRVKMLEQRPALPAVVVLTEQQIERIDRDLDRAAERIRRDLAADC